MRNWFMSLNGAITLSVIALLTFLGRGFMDWRYEYPLQVPSGAFDIHGACRRLDLGSSSSRERKQTRFNRHLGFCHAAEYCPVFGDLLHFLPTMDGL